MYVVASSILRYQKFVFSAEVTRIPPSMTKQLPEDGMTNDREDIFESLLWYQTAACLQEEQVCCVA